ncbi:uncharacterized protein LOC141885162 isoform X4 [Acropora palmata]|uniref:uncharacterized protein LOC141885162 isoform X4 n=1 Tax=Acropora palmata TaxID=6131 RepID=UPI003DA16FEA
MEPGQFIWTGTSNFVTWDVQITLELWPVESSVGKVRLKFWTMSSSQTSALTQEPEESTVAASVPDMSNTESTELAAIPKVKHAPFQSLPTLRGEITEEQLKDPGEIFRKEQAKKYFSLRNGAFTNAVEECKLHLDEHDGELVGGWLLSEIDHWDHEKERIILITKKALCVVKYNFIGLKVDEVKKIPLIQCDKIQIGRFVYPKNTMMMLVYNWFLYCGPVNEAQVLYLLDQRSSSLKVVRGNQSQKK